jgi:RHS repeat-associated protein
VVAVSLHFDGTGALASSFAYMLGAAGERLRVTESGPATRERVVDYGYDAVYRLMEESIDEPGTENDRRIEYAYDAVGNRLTRRVTIGTRLATTTYSYDANDRLTTETTAVGHASAASLPPPGFDAHSLIFGGAALGHAGVALAVMLGALLFAAAQLLGSRRDWARAGSALAYGLAFVAAVGLVFEPIEVLAANPGFYLGEAPVAAPASTALAAEAVTYTYDENGNLVARAADNGVADTFTYDFENRMAAAQIATGPQPANVTYAYDADGLRTRQVVNGVVTDYVFDKGVGFGQLALARSAASAVAYVHGDDLVSQTHTSTGTSYFHADGNMSIRHLSDAGGATSDTFTYDAFGILLDRTGSTPNEFRYAGEQYDPNAGFYYLRARYYQPGNGRFTARDPWNGNPMEPRTLHKYVYANSSPTMFRDPSGMWTLLEQNTVLQIVGILAGYALAQLVSGEVLQLIFGGAKRPLGWNGTIVSGSFAYIGATLFRGKSECRYARGGPIEKEVFAFTVMLKVSAPTNVKPFGVGASASASQAARMVSVAILGPRAFVFWGFSLAVKAELNFFVIGPSISYLQMGYAHYDKLFKPSWGLNGVTLSMGLSLEVSAGLSVGIPIGERKCTPQ